jgi:hypothetical protein
LLYYARRSSFWELLRPLAAEKEAEVRAIFDSSVFDFIWLFDATNDEVSLHFSRVLDARYQLTHELGKDTTSGPASTAANLGATVSEPTG